MFPLYDKSAPRLKPPYVTLALIFINVLVFIFVFFSGNFEEIIFQYGTIPSQILEGERLFTLFTSIFLHAGILHLVGNMWFLWIFGDNIEYNLGKIKFLIFYLAVGIFASLFHVFGAPAAQAGIPAIGASGAISGVLGSYVILYPKNRIRAFIIIFFHPILFWVPAYLYVGAWFFYQLAYIGQPTSIAYLAHIGGFISGIILILLLRRKGIRGVPLRHVRR